MINDHRPISGNMKSLFIFSLSVLFSSTLFAQALTWSGEITVANGSTYGKTRPRIVITSGNIPVVMWGGGVSNQPLYAARWNGTGFNTPVTVTPPNLDPFIDIWAGADMAVSGNTIFVVFKAEPLMTGNIYVISSTDGGVTWGTPVQANINSPGMVDLPSIAVSDAGNPSVMFMSFDSLMLNPFYAVASSTDGGATYPVATPVSTVGSSEVCDCCPGYMAIKGNYFVPAWRRNDSNTRDMWVGISSDGGATYNVGLDVDNTNWMLSSCPSSGPSPYLTNDSIVVAHMSGASGDNRIYLSTHSYPGYQTGISSFVDNNVSGSAIQNYPFLAGSNDTVALVYQESLTGNTEAMYSYSYTGASGLVNNSFILNNSTPGNQKNPHLAYASGVFHFVWVDYVSGNVMYKAGSIPTGVAENTNCKPLPVYPNPGNESVRIDLSVLNGEKGMLEVFDVNGKLVASVNVSGMKNYSLEKQIPGVYMVKLSGESFRQLAKVIFY